MTDSAQPEGRRPIVPPGIDPETGMRWAPGRDPMHPPAAQPPGVAHIPPYYQDDWLTIYAGDCRDVLRTLPSDSVDMVCTSPPYWGLRDYGTATWSGGDEECDHQPRMGVSSTTSLDGGVPTGSPRDRPLNDCKCGATRIDSQLGLERTPEEYVANMVAVFREVRRVLKPSGTCWLNLGDSYAANGEKRNNNGAGSSGLNSNRAADVPMKDIALRLDHGLKPKDLVGIPWRVAFALQADGWYLRSDIIWSKPNPMPESVTDRPTKSHEYLFLLTKSPRYFFDADAVREPHTTPNGMGWAKQTATQDTMKTDGDFTRPKDRRGMGMLSMPVDPAGRNIRSVWNIATRPYPGAHFAVFPPELPERCIKAGSSEKGVCPECGAPWERVQEKGELVSSYVGTDNPNWHEPAPKYVGVEHDRIQRRNADGKTLNQTSGWKHLPRRERFTTGWRPTCKHPTDPYTRGFSNPPSPAVILDPFGGSGTVGMVANRLSRRAILIDLNPEYLEQQMERNAQAPLGLGAA